MSLYTNPTYPVLRGTDRPDPRILRWRGIKGRPDARRARTTDNAFLVHIEGRVAVVDFYAHTAASGDKMARVYSESHPFRQQAMDEVEHFAAMSMAGSISPEAGNERFPDMTEGHRHAAGIVITDPMGRVLLNKRGGGLAHPGTWSIPGGQARTPFETPLVTAIREASEETGIDAISLLAGLFNIRILDRSYGPNGQVYVTFAAEVRAPVHGLRYSHECVDWAWVSWPQMGQMDLHPAWTKTASRFYNDSGLRCTANPGHEVVWTEADDVYCLSCDF